MFAVPPAFLSASDLRGLDSFTTGLKAVRALKRKYNGYAGSCIRIRRSSDNAEQDIGFTTSAIDAPVDSAAAVSFAGAGSAFVTKIYDQSGNGDNWVQATAGKQPRVVNAGVYDGFVRFDGSSQSMSSVNNSGAVPVYNIAFKVNLRSGGVSGRVIFDRGDQTNATFNYSSLSTGAISGSGFINVFKTEGTSVFMGNGFAIATSAPNGSASWAGFSYPTAGAAGCELWRGSTKFTSGGTTSAGTVSTGISGTALPWYLGARNNSAFWADIDWFSDAVYEGVVSDADKVTIMAILDR